MPIERYCTVKDCPGGDGCTNKYRRAGDRCTMEYVAADMKPEFRWSGDEPPPSRQRGRATSSNSRHLAFSDITLRSTK